ncbi:MAG: hypothetical protein HOP15_17955 [Planctomycetes bacterium]|nr:hypothetical protein [Planctomycetota bacterium]
MSIAGELRRFVTFALSLGLLGAAAAAQNNWTGAVSTDWGTAGNWSLGSVPTSTVDVVIPNVTNDPSTNGVAGAACRALTVQNAGLLDIAAGFPLSMAGNVTINAGGAITCAESFACAQALTVNGTLTTSGSLVQTSGTLTVGSGGSMQATSATSLVTQGSLLVSGPLNAPQAILTASAGATIFATGTITLGSGVHTMTGTLASNGSVNIPGKIQFVGASGGLDSIPRITVQDVDVMVSGGFTLSTVLVTGTFQLFSGTMTVTNAPVLQGPAIFQGGNYGSSSALLTLEGSTTFSGTMVSAVVNLLVKGSWTSDANFNPQTAGSSMRFAGTGAQSVSVASSNFGFPNLTITAGTSIDTGTKSVVMPGALTVNGTLTTTGSLVQVASTLTVASTGSLQATSATSLVTQGSLLVSGPLNAPQAILTASAGASIFTTGTITLGTGVHTMTGTLASNGSVNIPGKIQFVGASGGLDSVPTITVQDVDVMVSGGFTLSTVLVTGTFQLFSGTMTVTNAPVLQGPAIFQGGNYGSSSALLTLEGSTTFSGTMVSAVVNLLVKGSWTSDANFNPQTAGSSMRFAGTGAQSVSVASSNFGFPNLTITAGTSIDTGTKSVVMPGALTVNGTLTTTGSLVQVASTLTVASTGSLQATSATSLVTQGSLLVSGPLNAPQAILTASAGASIFTTGTITLGTGVHTMTGTLASNGSVNIPGKIQFVGASGGLDSVPTITVQDVDVMVSGGFTLDTVNVSGTFRLMSGNMTALHVPVLQGPAVFQGGTYAASALVTLENSTTFSGTTVSAAVNLLAKGSWTSDSSFNPTSGTVTFGGIGAQLVTMNGGQMPAVVISSTSSTTITDACHVKSNLTVSGSGSLTANGALDVDGSLTASGGSSNLSFAGVGSVVDGTFSASGAVAVDGSLELNSAASFLGSVSGTSGTGLVDCDANVTLQAASTLAPSFRFAQNVTVHSSLFAPTTGCAIFDGNGGQIVFQPSGAAEILFACLVIEPQTSVTFQDDLHVLDDTTWNGDGVVVGDALFDGAFAGTDSGAELVSTAGHDMEWRGELIDYDGVLIPGGIILITSPGSVIVDVPDGFGVRVDVGVGNLLTILNSTLTIGDALNILSGTVASAGDLVLDAQSITIEAPGRLDVLGNRVELTGGVAITVRGELAVGAGGELVLAASTVDVQGPSGELTVVGIATDHARATGGGIGGFSLLVGAGATLTAEHFEIQEMGVDGLRIDLNANVLALRDGTFDRVELGGVLLDIARLAVTQLDRLFFLDTENLRGSPNTFNVRTQPGSLPVAFADWEGIFGGPSWEDDLNNLAFWGSKLAFFIARDHPAANKLFWRTTREEDVQAFVIERSLLPPGTFTFVTQVAASGPQLYNATDATIVPGTPYRYRLSEILTFGPPVVGRILSEQDTDGLPGPPMTNPKGPPPPLPLAGDGSSPDPLGPVTLAGALDHLPSGSTDIQAYLDLVQGDEHIELALEGGIHAPFAWEPASGSSLRIVAKADELVAIDVSRKPVLVRGVGRDQSVELSGFVLRGSNPDAPALILENCAGPVVLDGLLIQSRRDEALVVTNSAAAVLQDVRIQGGLLLESDSSAYVSSSQARFARLRGHSTLQSSRFQGTLEVAPDSRSIAQVLPMPGLFLARPSDPGKLLVRLLGPAQASWQLFASERIGFRPQDGSAIPVLLDTRHSISLLDARRIGTEGQDELVLELPAELLGSLLYFQAFVTPSGTEAVIHAAIPSPLRAVSSR